METHRASYISFVAALAVAALTFTLYTNALTFGFVNWDDDVYVYENDRLQMPSVANAAWFFSNPYYHSYIPATMLSHMIDFQVWEFNASGHHLTSIVVHAFNAFWVFVLTLQLLMIAKSGLHVRGFRELLVRESDMELVLASAFTALLYALHPLRVESVAWISDRKDLLCAFFVLPATMDYINAVAAGEEGKPARRWYWTSFVLFVFACLSKSIAVTLPVVLLLLDYFMLRRNASRDQLKKAFRDIAPFFAVAFALGVIALRIAPDSSSSDMFEIISPLQRVLLPFYNIAFYLAKTLVPIKLSPIYPDPETWEMVLALAVFTVISSVVYWRWKRGSAMLLLAWCSFIAMLAPSSVIVSAVAQTTADRYAYLATIPLFLLLGGAFAHLLKKFASANISRWAIVITAFAVIAFAGYTNITQQKIWMNSETLWGRAITLFPTMPLPYNNFGLALQSRGELERAAEAFDRAIAYKPNYLEAHLNLGNVWFSRGNWDEAERLFFRCVELDPQRAEVYSNLGVVASAKGSTLDALRWFRKSVEVNPEYAQGHFNIAALYAKMGNTAAATDELKIAARLGHPFAQENLKSQNIGW